MPVGKTENCLSLYNLIFQLSLGFFADIARVCFSSVMKVEGLKRNQEETNPCLKEQELTYQCFNKYNYEKSKCFLQIQNYKACKTFWVSGYMNLIASRMSKQPSCGRQHCLLVVVRPKRPLLSVT